MKKIVKILITFYLFLIIFLNELLISVLKTLVNISYLLLHRAINILKIDELPHVTLLIIFQKSHTFL